MGRQLGRCKKCNCQATIEERDNGVCIWCSARKLENEDINWLLNEISDLRDELARVKAESLRVVKLPPVPFEHHGTRELLACNNGGVWLRCNDMDYTIYRMDGTRSEYTALAPNATIQPVRLERWEDE